MGRHLTYANVAATLALVVALGGGAYAATLLPKNSVGATQLQKNAVTGKKVKNGSLKSVDFKAGQLPTGAQGPQGPKGDKGEKGDTGNKGDKGDTGAPGASAASYLGWFQVTFTLGASSCGKYWVGAPYKAGDTEIIAPDYGDANPGTVSPAILVVPARVTTDGVSYGSLCNVTAAPVTVTNGRFDVWRAVGPAGARPAARPSGTPLEAHVVGTTG
jgi:hypothetical protein